MRKKYISRSNFQWQFALFLFLLVLVITLFVSLSVYFTLWIELLKGEVFFEEMMVRTGKLVAGKIGVLLILEAILCFLFSHRIAGPISRIEKIIGLLQRGDLSRDIQIRKTDELNGFVNEINQLVFLLRGQVKKEKKLIKDVKGKMDVLSGLLIEEKVDKRKILMIQKEIEKIINSLEEGKGQFKLE
ncbi:hypothetical protein KAU39_01715 [bacterium]|nr:hypothetical protein [bacterium]